MPAPNAISADKLKRLIGLPSGPLILDARGLHDGRLLPASVAWPAGHGPLPPVPTGQGVVVACEDGRATSHGVAALLRQEGGAAEVVEGGIAGWAAEGFPLVPAGALPRRDAAGRTLWVTRARPKVDRIACPWLVRRFVDPLAVFLFAPAADVPAVAAQLGAEPFDIEGEDVRWSHAGDRCSFDAMVEGFGLGGFEALDRLSAVVRGADTGHSELAPEAAGLLAVSLGLSRMFDDDNDQLEAGMLLYDALYRWSRNATGETHNWESHQPGSLRGKSRQ
jgi:rhodanese-related sulfurtransferase